MEACFIRYTNAGIKPFLSGDVAALIQGHCTDNDIAKAFSNEGLLRKKEERDEDVFNMRMRWRRNESTGAIDGIWLRVIRKDSLIAWCAADTRIQESHNFICHPVACDFNLPCADVLPDYLDVIVTEKAVWVKTVTVKAVSA